jgi:hypothetical protein
MKNFLCFLLISINICWVYGSENKVNLQSMKEGEKDSAFVTRVTKYELVKDDKGNAQLGRTTKFLGGKELLLAFTNAPFDEDPKSHLFDVDIHAFMQRPVALSYEAFEPIIACEAEGGSGSLRAFFYTTLEKKPVVGVICGWDATHVGLECQLNDEVRFIKVDEHELSLIKMDKYKKFFYSQVKPDKKSDFTCTVEKFKTVKDVKDIMAKNNLN